MRNRRKQGHHTAYTQVRAMAALLLVGIVLATAIMPLVRTSPASARALNPVIKVDSGSLIPTPTPVIEIVPGKVKVTPTETPVVIEINPDVKVTPIETPTVIDVVPSAQPSTDPVVDIPATRTAAGAAAIAITKHVCDEDQTGATYDQLVQTCAGNPNGFVFRVSAGGAFVQSQTTGSGVDGGVQFNGLTQGAYSIVEQVPAGFGQPRVFCDVQLAGDANGPGGFVEESVLDGNQIFHPFQAGEFVACDWFNFSSDASGGVIIMPEGATIDVTGDLPIIDLPNCVDGEPQTIHLPEGVELDITRRRTTRINKIVVLPDGASSGQRTASDQDVEIHFPQTVDIIDTGDGIDIIIPACDDLDETPVVGKITIGKSACPLGFNAAAATIYDLTFACNEPMDNIGFILSANGQPFTFNKTNASGVAAFDAIPAGELVIREEIPLGYGEPAVFCQTNDPAIPAPGDTIAQTVVNGDEVVVTVPTDGEVNCQWFNIPLTSSDAGDGIGSIELVKLACPAGFDAATADIYDFAAACQQPMSNVTFLLSDGAGAIAVATTDANGGAAFSDVPAIPLSLVEQVPSGYAAPVVFCISNLPDDSQIGPSVQQQVLDGNQIFHLMQSGESLACTWYNIPETAETTDADATIRVIKYTCDAGYDYSANGADPRADCKHRTNDVTFTLTGPAGFNASGVTGDSGDKGKTIFTDLAPGDYTLHEMVPAGTEMVFVLTCENLSVDVVQGYPLSVGSTLNLTVAPHDLIICRWYNVPALDDAGSLKITKYACATPYFVSALDCEIYENSVTFTLNAKQGSQWLTIAEGATNAAGELVWSGIAPGTYQLDEINGTWCHATSDRTDADGNLAVVAGEVTHVAIFNCRVATAGKPPVKLPNTGVAPVAAATAPSRVASVAVLDPTQWMGVLDERLIAPFVGPDRPATVQISAISLSAGTETLETVDGTMQNPTTADHIAWYKDSAALGESGNVVMAGHLNYWGVPEGVFYRLSELAPGDEIVVTSDHGRVYRYRVVWVKQVDAGTGELDEIAGPTDSPSLTLITCGGQWDSAAQQYNQRTIVRAELITED